MFKIINNGKLLTRATKYSACVDVYANETTTIQAGETKLIPLGICIDLRTFEKNYGQKLDNRFLIKEMPSDLYLIILNRIDDFKNHHYLQLALRSSLGAKGLILPSGIGIIDFDYKDEIKMIIHNPIRQETYKAYGSEDNSYQIKKGDRIGQITLLEHKSYLFGIESDDDRDGGFGSSGGN